VSHPDKGITNWVKQMNRLINGGSNSWNGKSSEIKQVVIIWAKNTINEKKKKKKKCILALF
jgi:hypothetical protein